MLALRTEHGGTIIMTKITYFIGGLVIMATVPAIAANPGDVPTVKVYFNDLDLRTDAGVNTFDGRLRRAISRICGGPPRGGHMEMLKSSKCRAETLADVTPQRDAVIRLARSGTTTQVAGLAVKAATRAN
jgi:UrcA family protein